MNDRIDGVETESTQPTRADRADQATRMMEEARALDAAAREAALRAQQQARPAGFAGSSEFEPRPRSPGSSTGLRPALNPAPTTQPPAAQAPVVSARALAAEATGGSPAVRELREASGELEQARSAREQADQELGRRMARLGPALTPQQQADFSQRYRQQNAAIYQRGERATERVSSLFRERAADLRRATATPAGAGTVSRGLAALAATPRAAEALEFAGSVAAAGGPSAENLLRAPNFGRDVLERALPNAAASLLAGGAQASEIGREVLRLATPFLPTVTGVLQGHRVLQEAGALAAGNTDALRNLVTRWQDSSSVMRGLGAAGGLLSIGTAVHGTMSGRAAAQQLEDYSRAGQAGAELTSNILRSLGTGARGAATATALARLAPGIGFIANAASLAHNASRFMDTRNAGFAVAATGDAIATLGSALGAVPIGTVPGAAINALGQVISAGGDLTANHIQHRRSAEEQVRQLEANGMSRVTAQALVENPAAVHQLSRLGLSPEQIQGLASGRPDLLGRPADLQVMGEAARALGLPPQETLATLGALSTRELSTLTAGLAQARSPAEQRAFLEQMLSVAPERFQPIAQGAIRRLLGR